MSCIKEGCKEPKTENAYCKKHKIYFLKEEGEKRGKSYLLRFPKKPSNITKICHVIFVGKKYMIDIRMESTGLTIQKDILLTIYVLAAEFVTT